MANYYGNPMVLDTTWSASTIPAALKPPTGPTDSTNLRNEPINAKRIEWLSPASIGDTAVITDINGNPILSAVGEVALGSQLLYQDSRSPLKLKMGGWVLTIGSGKLLIYY
jgi:hypothetical protein